MGRHSDERECRANNSRNHGNMDRTLGSETRGMIDSSLLTPLGRLIRGARLRMDITLEEASLKLGIGINRLAEYEHGTRVPRIKRAIVLAEFYGIPVQTFLEKRGKS